MARTNPLCLAAATACALLASPAARADLHYGFDTDAQGWTVFDGGTLTHQASGGAPGGFLQMQDASGGDMRLVLPGTAGGNWLGYLGGSLSFDARNLNGDAPDWPEFGQITLIGGAGIELVVDVVADGQPPADGLWHHYTTRLSTAVFGNTLPAVLGNLTELRIKTEFHNGVSEWVGIDNIAITSAVPEPASAALLLAGLAVGAGAARRRAQRP